jgi:hypothetical protein
MRRLTVLLCAVLLVCGIAGTATGESFYLSGVTSGSGWSDVEQNPSTAYCWVATASNMLAYSGWNGGFLDSAAIYAESISHWQNLNGNPYYDVYWWFTGVNLKAGDTSWPQLTSDGGGYYSDGDFDMGFAENVNGLAPSDVRTWLQWDVSEQRAFTMLLGNTGGGTHWLTGWGYELDAGAVTGVYFTDSFDGSSQLLYSPLNCSSGDCYLNVYSSYYLISMASLGYNSTGVPPNGGGNETVPEPTSTLVLLGIGLFGLSVGYRKRS